MILSLASYESILKSFQIFHQICLKTININFQGIKYYSESSIFWKLSPELHDQIIFYTAWIYLIICLYYIQNTK